MGIIDLTLEMERRQRNPHPCDKCQMGSASVGQWTDPKTGHLMQESHDCSETCQILKERDIAMGAKSILTGVNPYGNSLMTKQTFISGINALVKEYRDSSEYVPPIIKKQWLSWHFVGFWALSLGLHISLKHANIEFHLPFGFLKVSFKREAVSYFDVSIQV